jgi:hypothetical protein
MKTFHKLTEYFRRDKTEKLYALLEILLIVAWAIWVGRGMLNFDENNVPLGGEYGMGVSTHHFWTFVEKCGWCALWDGSQIGGYPALSNTYAAILHPVTMITTLIWGVVNGSKIIVVVSLAFAGIAQWWLAHELKIGLLARLWGSMLVIVGGHLAGKLEVGLVDLVLSTATCSFAFPAVLMVARHQDWRSAIVLAIVAASGILSGHGYVQILLLLTIPAFGFLLIDQDWKLNPLWKKYVVAAGLAILMTSVFIIPVMANRWNIDKSINPDFSTVQQLKFSLLNFVIDDFGFFQTDVLGKSAIPYLYINFIGWAALILAIFAVGASKEQDRRKILYLAGSAAIIVGFVDSNFLKWLSLWIPFLTSVRYPTIGLGIAVPAIIGLASYGIDQIMTRFEWPFIELGFGRQNNTRAVSIPLSLIVLIPLAINIQQAYNFGRRTLNVRPLDPGIVEKLESMKTDSLEWVMPVFGEHFWKEPAVRLGLKLTNDSLPFWVGKKKYPESYYQLTRAPLTDADGAILMVKEFEGEFLYLNSEAEYAIIIDQQGNRTICSAIGTGGKVDVTCHAPTNGKLVVYENWWPGWKVWIDGKPAPLIGTDFLKVNINSGEHKIRFRYIPIDAYFGMAVSLIGIGLCVYLWSRSKSNREETPEVSKPPSSSNTADSIS